MAVDPWMIDASGGTPAYTAQEARLLTVVPMFAGAGASLGVRTGVRPSGSNTDLLVQAQASPNMSVLVNPGVITAQGAISVSQGAYTWALDATTTLTIATAHATLARTDLVCVRIRDAGVDTSGQRDGAVTVITGTAGGGVPTLPTDATYVTKAQVAVGAGVTTIVAGNITSKRQFTASVGGVIYCPTSAEEPAASSVPLSQLTYRADLDMFRRTDGTSWFGAMPWRRVQTLAGTTASVTFSNIPSTLRVVRLDWTARGDNAALNISMRMRINGSSIAGGYSWAQIFSINGATPTTATNLSDISASVGNIPAANATVSYYGAGTVECGGWNNFNFMVAYTARSGFAASNGSIADTHAGTFFPSGPYTSITLFPATGNFTSGSQFVLTGIE